MRVRCMHTCPFSMARMMSFSDMLVGQQWVLILTHARQHSLHHAGSVRQAPGQNLRDSELNSVLLGLFMWGQDACQVVH